MMTPKASTRDQGCVGTETVTEDHEVSEILRKEEIDDPDIITRHPPANPLGPAAPLLALCGAGGRAAGQVPGGCIHEGPASWRCWRHDT
jgi:hypothetical protein